MGRILSLGAGVAMIAIALTACGDEDPTAVGGRVVEEGFRTYEVVLDAEQFLAADTTYDSLGSVSSAPFLMVANAFEDQALSAHTLFRINRPQQVTWTDSAGASQTDTLFSVVGATVTLVVDTLGDEPGPVALEVLDLTESWDRPTVTWELRSDTGGTAVPWTQPGGTAGAVRGTETWTAGDTLRIPLDSAAAAFFTDSAAAERGGLLRSATPGTRLRIQSLTFDFEVRPESADTVVSAGSAGFRTFVATPEASAAPGTELRVGGLPTWRSALHLRALETLEIPCATDVVGCSLPLEDAAVNLATILLHPVPVGSRRIERPLSLEMRTMLRAEGIPISRSPMSGPLGFSQELLTPQAFTAAPAEPMVAQVPITGYVRAQLDRSEDQEQLLWLALLVRAELASPVFGYAAFGSLESAQPPQLRLVVTVPEEVQP